MPERCTGGSLSYMRNTVKPDLTPKRERETPEYAAMLRRMLRAYARRVGDADDVDLAEMVELRDELEAAIRAAVWGQRRNHGASWADIGRGLGVTRQAAQMRYGEPPSST